MGGGHVSAERAQQCRPSFICPSWSDCIALHHALLTESKESPYMPRKPDSSNILANKAHACLCPLRQILANFGLDVLEALSGTCTHWVAGRRGAGRQLAADAVVAFGITVLHAVMLMCQVRRRRPHLAVWIKSPGTD